MEMNRRLNWELSLAIIGLATNLINLTFIIVIVWHGFAVGSRATGATSR